MGRFLPLLLLAGMLGGCATSGPIALAGTHGCGLMTAFRMAMAGLPCRVPKPPPAPYCTRSLADVDCWTDPQALGDRPPQVADGGWEAPPLPPRAAPATHGGNRAQVAERATPAPRAPARRGAPDDPPGDAPGDATPGG